MYRPSGDSRSIVTLAPGPRRVATSRDRRGSIRRRTRVVWPVRIHSPPPAQARAVTAAGWRMSSRRASPAGGRADVPQAQRQSPWTRWRGWPRRGRRPGPRPRVVAHLDRDASPFVMSHRWTAPSTWPDASSEPSGEKARARAAASWPLRWCSAVRSMWVRVRERRSQSRIPPSAPATASTSAAGESATSFVAGGSPKAPWSRQRTGPLGPQGRGVQRSQRHRQPTGGSGAGTGAGCSR